MGKTALAIVFSALAILFATAAAYSADDQEARALYLEAREKTLGFSFHCKVMERSMLDDYGAASADYYRLVKGDSVYNKLVFKDKKGKEILVFLQNDEGFFAMAGGVWAKIAEILPLHYYEYIAEDFSTPEMSLCEFTQKTIMHEGHKAIEITMDMTAPPQKIRWASREIRGPMSPTDNLDDIMSDYYQTRPVKRVFLLDPINHFIFSKACYNPHGKRIFQRVIKRPDFQVSLTEEDFMPDGMVTEEYVFLHDGFLSEHFNEVYPKKENVVKTPYRPSRFRIRHFLGWMFSTHVTYWLCVLLVAIALLCFVMASYFKRH